MAQTPEGKVKRDIKRLLDAVGAWFCMPNTGGYGRSGIPDFLVCQPMVVTPDMVGSVMGRFVGIEAKAPGKCANTTVMQDNEIAAINAAGGAAVVVDDVSALADIFPTTQQLVNALTTDTEFKR